jgi:hypothetical protein
MMRLRPLQIATLAIASIFVARAALRLLQPEFNILRFAVLGWPPWAVWVVSAAEIFGAALLLRANSFRFGALLLALVAAAFLLAYVRIGVPEAGMGSAGMLIALAGLTLLRRYTATA